MRRVETKRFQDYFRKGGPERFDFEPGIDWDRFFYVNRTRFNRQWTVLLLLVAFFFLSTSMREGWVLLLTGIVSLGALYLRTRAVAHGIHLSRKIPPRAKEHQKIDVVYEVRNASEFEASHLWIRDFFTGSRRHLLSASSPEGIPGLSIRNLGDVVRCDGGMGVHSWGPLVATVTDPLGIFEFTIVEDEPVLMEVLPEFLILDGFTILESLDSSAIGTSESVRAGQSSNFLGLREYVPGDPIKRINWKLSARHQELVVNVFESRVHTDLTVCIDMDARNHIGRPGDCTWEACKDVAVSILHDQRPKTHRMQLASQELRIPFDRGASHLLSMVKRIAALEPVRIAAGSPPLLSSLAESIPYGSSLVYVTPVYQNDAGELTRSLDRLQSRAVRCVVVLVQASDYVHSLPAGLAFHAVAERNRAAGDLRDRILRENTQLGVPTYVVTRDRPIPHSLARPVLA